VTDLLAGQGVHDRVALVVKSLGKRYETSRGGVQALENVDLEIKAGEFVAVVGASGCGKSTLLRILAGLDGYDTGQAIFNGRPISKPDASRAVVFQHYGLLPWRTVQGNVELALQIQGLPRSERTEQARSAIARVGLSGFEQHYPAQLSGGMQQRVGLARALTKRPQLLLMDEPFAAVDLQTRERLQEELLEVWREVRCTTLFITHGIDEAVFLADRVIVMKPRPGRVIGIVDIDIPRPRYGDEVRTSPAFAQHSAEIRTLLHSVAVPTAQPA
jgi:NitT/TauT family transport system ATP-binding protein